VLSFVPVKSVRLKSSTFIKSLHLTFLCNVLYCCISFYTVYSTTILLRATGIPWPTVGFSVGCTSQQKPECLLQPSPSWSLLITFSVFSSCHCLKAQAYSTHTLYWNERFASHCACVRASIKFKVWAVQMHRTEAPWLPCGTLRSQVTCVDFLTYHSDFRFS